MIPMSLKQLMGIKLLYEIVTTSDPKRSFRAHKDRIKTSYPFDTEMPNLGRIRSQKSLSIQPSPCLHGMHCSLGDGGRLGNELDQLS